MIQQRRSGGDVSCRNRSVGVLVELGGVIYAATACQESANRPRWCEIHA